MTIRDGFGRWLLHAVIWFIAIAAFLLACSVAAACPNCKDSLDGSDKASGGNLVSGFYYSIIFMLSMPFTICGVFGFCAYRSVRRARAASENSPAAGQSACEPPQREVDAVDEA